MSRFSVVPLGVGDAFSTRYYSSCLLLEAKGTKMLIDCPHPIRKIFKESTASLEEPVDVGDIDTVLLTHLHADHCSGVEGFAFFSFFVLKKKVHLVGAPVAVQDLWNKHLAAGMENVRIIDKEAKEGVVVTQRSFDDFFDFDPLSMTEPTKVGPFTIACRETIHHIPTTALKIWVDDKCLGYSADTAFDPGLIEWLEEADMIIHETNLGTHTPYEELMSLPEHIKEKMHLIHYPDFFEQEERELRLLVEGEKIVI
ncbi:MAG: MBL fold hydrolase [Deltaproteobacteria bacterium]|nr:MBL fold hydrolase [Deltaproteobacteria bacterium]MBU52692.1 MBL fold hydrolase [Deltaproteobacteria bacterium]|tara:strand:- start:7569 stop:8333 length:765 start_codon:yes stop_codon:yes gene_type:complete